MIGPQQSRQRWELSPNLGVLVNSVEGAGVRLAPLVGCVLGALVNFIERGRVRLVPLVERIFGALVSSRVRLVPLVARLRTVQLRSSRVAKVRIDVVRRIKAAAMWTFVTIELGLLIALIVGGFLIYASTTKSALIS